MEAPTIGEPQNMAKIESDVVKTVMQEFVYHNIKNLGFDESNVHVHVSNGGHSDVVAGQPRRECGQRAKSFQDDAAAAADRARVGPGPGRHAPGHAEPRGPRCR